jgi:hypothetical protein
MSDAKQRSFLVIRYGFTQKYDAIDEIEHVLARRDMAWFGKYGQPIGRSFSRYMTKAESEVLVILVTRAASKGGSGNNRAQTFRLVELSATPPKDSRSYPAYYRANLDRIGSWLQLKRYCGPDISLSDLAVRSSFRPVLEAMSVSQRGYFLCRLRS